VLIQNKKPLLNKIILSSYAGKKGREKLQINEKEF